MQRRYGALSPRDGGKWQHNERGKGYEFVYYSSDTDMHTGTRRGALPAGWKKPHSVSDIALGRYCLGSVPTRDGKLQFAIQTTERDYVIQIAPLIEGVRFYAAYRTRVCGDSLAIVATALRGTGLDGTAVDEAAMHSRLVELYEEQCRIKAMGFDKFEAAAALCRAGGDGDRALASLVANGPASLDEAQAGGTFGGIESGWRSTNSASSAAPRTFVVSATSVDGQPAEAAQPSRIVGTPSVVALPPVRVVGTPSVVAPPPVRVAGTPSVPAPAVQACGLSSVAEPSMTGVRDLVAMGFSTAEATEALVATQNNLDNAIMRIIERRDAAPTPPPLVSTSAAASSAAAASPPPPSSRPSNGQPVWEYEDGGSGWVAYRDEDQDALNVAKACEETTVTIEHPPDVRVSVHLDSMTQFDLKSGDFKPVRCTGGVDHEAEAAAAVAAVAQAEAQEEARAEAAAIEAVAAAEAAAAPEPLLSSAPRDFFDRGGNAPPPPPLYDLASALPDLPPEAAPVLDREESSGAAGRALFAQLLSGSGEGDGGEGEMVVAAEEAGGGGDLMGAHAEW